MFMPIGHGEFMHTHAVKTFMEIVIHIALGITSIEHNYVNLLSIIP